MNEVIRYKAPKTGNAAAKSGGGIQWRILIVDKLAKRMVSACVKMHDINAEGVTRKYPFILAIILESAMDLDDDEICLLQLLRT